ncbi:hypothetical protein DM02DRAFT_63484 [Periconia macrospinosa]|uniref:Uncharacterized protein n=1 Tax=Periconia macrospinosa TaxID=97972 RepID=A0A2V1DIF1_9PLEO|nr:hypothetical protein DM02DRAFT_63484 [Periconia macrospinosa]
MPSFLLPRPSRQLTQNNQQPHHQCIPLSQAGKRKTENPVWSAKQADGGTQLRYMGSSTCPVPCSGGHRTVHDTLIDCGTVRVCVCACIRGASWV